MLEVNISNLKNEILKIEALINEYEEVELNLFHQLDDSCINWKDGNSKEFSMKINLEKRETDQLLEIIKTEKDVYQYIINKYQEIGKKVYCQLHYKSSILSAIQDCEREANSILSSFNGVDSGISGSIYSTIMNQKSKIEGIKKSLANFTSSIENMYSKLQEMETEIGAKMKELKEIKIQDFEFQTLTGGSNG